MENMNTDAIKNCPFCGGEAIVYEDKEYDAYMIGCKNCCAVEPMTEWTSKENAIAQWNWRKPLERIVERLEEEHRKSEECPKFEKVFRQVAFEEAIAIVKEEGGLNG